MKPALLVVLLAGSLAGCAGVSPGDPARAQPLTRFEVLGALQVEAANGWTAITRTPAEVRLDPARRYRLEVAGVPLSGTLGSLARLAGAPVRELKLGNAFELEPRDLVPIGSMSQLEVLEIQEGVDLGPGLRHLRGLTRLRTLVLTSCDSLRDAHLAHLEPLRALTGLDLSQAYGLRGSGLASLTRLSQLRTLNLESCVLLETIASLAGCPALVELDLSGCRALPGESLAALVSLDDTLRDLNLRGCGELGDAAFIHLGRLRRLRALDLSSFPHDGGPLGEEERACLREVRKIRALERLWLDHYEELDAGALLELVYLPRLRELSLASVDLAPLDFAALELLTGLRKICCQPEEGRLPRLPRVEEYEAYVAGPETALAASFPALRVLHASSDDELALLRQAPRLERLVVRDHTGSVTGRGLAELARCPRLEELDLCIAKPERSVGFRGLLLGVRRLSLQSGQLEDPQLLPVLQALSRLEEITSLGWLSRERYAQLRAALPRVKLPPWREIVDGERFTGATVEIPFGVETRWTCDTRRVRVGKYIEWTLGQRTLSGRYRVGKKHGRWIVYEHGEPASEQRYRDGERVD